ncbi:MAG: 5-formyltetrahydrofolate cyclo-ligase [Chitinophagaceae bacterium]
MLKKEARFTFKEKRKEISSIQKMKWDDLLLIEFQKINLPFLSAVLSYYPFSEQNEPETFTITDYLFFTNPDLLVCYPKIDRITSTLSAIVVEEEGEFINNSFGIPEPSGSEAIPPDYIDVVLVPLLAFDNRGFRVGYGKGFYDRFLKDCRQDCLKIGLSYFHPIDVIEDANQYDVPLDICITPQKIYVF